MKCAVFGFVLVVACNATSSDLPDSAVSDAGHTMDAGSVPCAVDATDPSVPGARLHVEADRCRVQSDRTHEFRYTLELDEALAAEVPDSHGSCGICGVNADPRSLVRFQIGSPLEPHYCECAGGCCPPTSAHSQPLDTGVFEQTIVWPGRQWNGASDTSEPLGPPFPPGVFSLKVTFNVLGNGSLTASLPLEVFAESQ
jgi:hypothetical protein